MMVRTIAPPNLSPADPFCPRRKFYGSVVPDCVMSSKILKPVSKLLLGRLYKYAGELDRCNPSLPTLAEALGASVDKIGRSLKELEAQGLIRSVRHARKEADRVLLWNPLLSDSLRKEVRSASNDDSAKTQNHASDETAEVRNHDPVIPQNEVDDSAKTAPMIPQNRDRYKEKRIKKENLPSNEHVKGAPRVARMFKSDKTRKAAGVRSGGWKGTRCT